MPPWADCGVWAKAAWSAPSDRHLAPRAPAVRRGSRQTLQTGSGSQRRSASPSSPHCSSSLSPRSVDGRGRHRVRCHRHQRRAFRIGGTRGLGTGAPGISALSCLMEQCLSRQRARRRPGTPWSYPRAFGRLSIGQSQELPPMSYDRWPDQPSIAARLQALRRRGHIREQGVKEVPGRLVHLAPHLRENAYCSPVRAVSIRSSRAVSMKVSLGLAIRVLTRGVWP